MCSNPHHVLVFFVAVSLGPPLCRFAWALGATSSIEIRPAASSSLSHSPHRSFVSPGWSSCHLITSASTLPVHWPGLCAPRIDYTFRQLYWHRRLRPSFVSVSNSGKHRDPYRSSCLRRYHNSLRVLE